MMTGARLALVTLYTESDAADFLSLATTDYMSSCACVGICAPLIQNPPYENHVPTSESLVFVLQCMCVECVSVCVNVFYPHPFFSPLFCKV